MRFEVNTEHGTYFREEDVALKKIVSDVLAERVYIDSMRRTLERQVSINGKEEVYVVSHGANFFRLVTTDGVAYLHQFMKIDSIVPEHEEKVSHLCRLPAVEGEPYRQTLLRFQEAGFPMAYSYHYTPVLKQEG